MDLFTLACLRFREPGPSTPDDPHHPDTAHPPALLVNAGLLAAWSGVLATAMAAGCPADPQGVLQLPEMEPEEQVRLYTNKLK
jgi:hypothetical protein